MSIQGVSNGFASLASQGVTVTQSSIQDSPLASELQQLMSQGQSPQSGSASQQSKSAFMTAIDQVLAQLGTSPNADSSNTSDTSGTSSSSSASSSGSGSANSDTNQTAQNGQSADPNSALQQFVGALFQAMASLQQGGGSSSSTSQDGSGSVGGVSNYSSLSQALDELANEVGANGNQASGAGGDSSSDSSDSSSQAISTLEQDFNNLSSATGNSNGTSLQTFLQSLASNLGQNSDSVFGSAGTFVQTVA